VSQAEKAPKPGSRSGSQKRQRQGRVLACFNEAELARVRRLSEDSGHSASALVRNALLDTPLPRRRRPANDAPLVARLLGELADLKSEWGKQGSNINQLAFQLNADRFPPDLREALQAIQDAHEEQARTLLELRDACMRALGFERDDD